MSMAGTIGFRIYLGTVAPSPARPYRTGTPHSYQSHTEENQSGQ